MNQIETIIKERRTVFFFKNPNTIIRIANMGINQKTENRKLNCGKGFANPNFSPEVLKKSPSGREKPLMVLPSQFTQNIKKDASCTTTKNAVSPFNNSGEFFFCDVITTKITKLVSLWLRTRKQIYNV